MLLSQSQKENHKVVRSFYFDQFYVKIHTYLLEFHAIQPIGKLVEQLSFNHVVWGHVNCQNTHCQMKPVFFNLKSIGK